MITAVKFKIYILNDSIFSIISYKLSYEQRFYIVILLKINKNSKIYSYYTIWTFDLTINLKMQNNKKFVFYLKEVVEQKPEF